MPEGESTIFAGKMEARTSILSTDERQILLLKAGLRRQSAELRVGLSQLHKPGDSALGEKFNRELSSVQAEIDVVPIKPEEAREKLAKDRENLTAKAETCWVAAPNLVALIYANLAKLEMAAGQDFKESFSLAQKATKLAGKIPKTTPKAYLPEAIAIGIAKQKLAGKELPSPDMLAKSVADSPDLIGDIALALTEEERQEFLRHVTEDQRQRLSVLMDRELAGVLSERVIAEQDKPERETVKQRVEEKLKAVIGEDSDSGMLTKLLAETLAEMGDTESKDILETLSKESVLQAQKSESERASITARLVRTLAEFDSASGSSLAMRFLGRKELNQHYFRYFTEYLLVKGYLAKNLDQAESWPEERCVKLHELLKEREQDWQDEANVSDPFMRGVAIFGWQKMFGFAGRPDVTRHDALFGFDKIIDLYQESGLRADQFYGQILSQVHLDSASYDTGNSYNELNAIANSINLSEGFLASMQEKIARYPKIRELQELNSFLTNKDEIFSSWNSLKKFVDLSRLLEQAQILDELEELEEEAQRDPKKAKLCQFIKTLAFHRDSKVNMQAVLQFWRNPENFLETSDIHTPDEVQSSKKPSNYTEIPNLDLNATELRDALIDGTLDHIQAFLPLEVVYSVKDDTISETVSFVDEVRREIGSRKDGTANKPLFNEINKIFKAHGLNFVEFLTGDRAISLAAVEQQEAEAQIREAMAKFPNQKIERVAAKPLAKRYRARVNYKSDPQAVLAGDDTACCMPFGSGKNNIYMFNPGCSLFTLEEEKGDGKWRTIAQSVLTLDQDIGKSIPEIVDGLRNNKTNLATVLPDKVLTPGQYFLACDNVEVAGNAQNKTEIIRAIYQRFFERYLSYYNSHNEGAPLNQQKVLVGSANSDFHFQQTEANVYAPAAPVGYSDKLGAKVEVINIGQGDTKLAMAEESLKQIEETGREEQRKSGVLPLTFKDSLAVAYLEGKAYTDNESLITYLHDMENGLIAKDINNEAKQRPNLSAKYVDETGRMRGYILAYEGKSDGGEPMIYISDLASDRESSLAGGRLINAFLENYKINYLNKGNTIPIFVQARENTSYQIIKRNIDSMSRKLGVKIEIDEENAYHQGNDTMHALWLRPVTENGNQPQRRRFDWF